MAIGVATTTMILGAWSMAVASSPGFGFFLMGTLWTAGAIAALGVLAIHWRSMSPASRFRGLPLAAVVVSGSILLLGLVAWAALATWGCLFNPDAPWHCPLGR